MVFFKNVAEKILGVPASKLQQLFETEEDRYNAVFTETTFKRLQVRMRVKEERLTIIVDDGKSTVVYFFQLQR